MSIKRHPVLQPFSRDHLIGLFHAQKLMKLKDVHDDGTVASTISAFADAWEREISVHFADEDRLLGPLPVNASSLRRLDEEHVDLRAAIMSILERPHDVAAAARVGALLDAHIRWEEHDLFPEIETSLSAEEMDALGVQTALVEASRQRRL